ncbi:plasminogen-like [Gigantopelta aegis]|uniref:plasminogen-like n=1 Tax=Gigantopelta aegis TaxID=1735272 RepID=UPI001B88A023|nr:plasminogen-like [Gigantopelta aegis]
MAARSFLLRPRRHMVVLVVLFCCVNIITNQTCSKIEPFSYVPCYADFNVSKLDLYNVSKFNFFQCATDCANTRNCWSFLYNSRHHTCASYRLKPTDTSLFPEGKYYLKYETEDDCGSSPKPEPECYLINETYAGRKMTTQSGITCQRWDQDSPHRQLYQNVDRFPEATLSAAENLCRSLDNPGDPWCYTVDRNIRWMSCGIPIC